MSSTVFKAVRDQPALHDQSGNALTLLLLIADHAHNDGTGAWPSQITLARETNLSERSVRDNLRGLEKAGVVETVRRGLQRTNSYVVHLPGLCGVHPPTEPCNRWRESAGQESAGVQESAGAPKPERPGSAAPDRKRVAGHKALKGQEQNQDQEIAGAEDQAPAQDVGVDESVGVVGAAPDHDLSAPTQTSGEPGEDRPEGVREAGSSGSGAHDETTTTRTEPEHRQPTKSTVPRKIFDATLDGFVAMMRRRPATDAEWSRWHKPAEEIGKAILSDWATLEAVAGGPVDVNLSALSPEAMMLVADFAFREIQRRANLFRRVYDFARLTPTALGSHWGELGPPVPAPTRGEDADPEPVESDLCEHGNPWGDCEECAAARREALKGFAGGIGGMAPAEPPSREEQLAKGRKLLEETGTSVMDQIAGGEEAE